MNQSSTPRRSLPISAFLLALMATVAAAEPLTLIGADPGYAPTAGPIPPLVRLPLTPLVERVVAANNAFAVDLFHQLGNDLTAGDNLLISPISVSTALAMIYAGARGETAAQMANVLHLNTIPATGPMPATGTCWPI